MVTDRTERMPIYAPTSAAGPGYPPDSYRCGNNAPLRPEGALREPNETGSITWPPGSAWTLQQTCVIYSWQLRKFTPFISKRGHIHQIHSSQSFLQVGNKILVFLSQNRIVYVMCMCSAGYIRRWPVELSVQSKIHCTKQHSVHCRKYSLLW